MECCVNNISSIDTSTSLQKAHNFLNGKHYKTVRYIQENHVLNRAALDLGSGFLPVVLIELIGRNWQTTAETIVGNVLRLLTNYAAPLVLASLWNNVSAKKHKLDLNKFQGLFKIQFKDLTPETPVEVLKERLVDESKDTESKKYVQNIPEDMLKSLKEKLLNAKSFVRKLDLMSIGFLTYISPWVRNWFTKNVLKVVGFPGEIGILSDAEREECSSFHCKFKYLKFFIGLVPLFGGIHFDSKNFQRAMSVPENEIESSKVIKWIRRNLSDFDFHDGFITKRANMLFQNIYGGITSRLLASRSVNEIIERAITAVVSITGNFWGDLIAHKALAKRYDKTLNTKIISNDDNQKVKTLNELETELRKAIENKDDKSVETHLKSVNGQIKTYYQSMSLSALVMAAVTVFRIWNTNRRVKSGAY